MSDDDNSLVSIDKNRTRYGSGPTTNNYASNRRGFLEINIGQVAIVLSIMTMCGSCWVVFNNVETTLENHSARIAAIEREFNERHTENAARLDRMNDEAVERYKDLAKQIQAVSHDLNIIQGQLMGPLKHGEMDFEHPDNHG